jgi:hypothetical protein
MKIPKTILWILLAAVIAGLAYGSVLLRHGISARKDPSQTEIRVARTLRHMAIPKLAEKMRTRGRTWPHSM